MAYLIDGNNLLGFLFHGYLRDPENKLKLIRRLIAFQRSKRARVILVFDGTALPDEDNIVEPGSRFTILHPSAGESADTVLMEILSRQSDSRKFFVVSSDREIKASAEHKGARVLNCREFNAELKPTLQERKAKNEMAKNDVRPTSLEVRLWTQVFKENK